MATVIRACECKSPYQDSKYGVGRRVFNEYRAKLPAGTRGYRCTVCRRERQEAK